MGVPPAGTARKTPHRTEGTVGSPLRPFDCVRQGAARTGRDQGAHAAPAPPAGNGRRGGAVGYGAAVQGGGFAAAAARGKRAARAFFVGGAAGDYYLIIGHYYVTRCGSMSVENSLHVVSTDLFHTAKVITYPCGIVDLVVSSHLDFRPPGWELSGTDNSILLEGGTSGEPKERKCADPQGEDKQRSMRRARAKVRRIALANDFRYFVTLTLDGSRIDRYDMGAIVQKLNRWLDNQVRRKGLRYVLVPERHKDGAIHFHGFFNDALEVVDSGVLDVPWSKKPLRPRNDKIRAEWIQKGGRIVYNLPGWTLGFTTAIEIYGEYPRAVAYVCKYIGKQGEKPAGRWYYSGGDLRQPEIIYTDLDLDQILDQYGDRAFMVKAVRHPMVVVLGISDADST